MCVSSLCVSPHSFLSLEPVKETKVAGSSAKHSVSVFEEMYKDEPKALTATQKVVSFCQLIKEASSGKYLFY